MTFKLPDTVYSPDQLQFCAEELHELANRITAQSRRGKQGGELMLSQPSVDLIAALPAAKQSDAATLDALSAELGERLRKSPVVHITLAAPAGHSLRLELVQWFRVNCAPDALLVFQVNPDIAGGIVVRTTNHVHDYSFRSLLINEPTRFVEVLERVR